MQLAKTIQNIFFKKILGRKKSEKLINRIAVFSNTDLLDLSYRNIGIGKYQNSTISGEVHFLNNVLPSLLKNSTECVFFDVGANVGNYSKELANKFSPVTIYSFEPNPKCFSLLVKNTALFSYIKPIESALGNEIGKLELFSYNENITSEHGTIYKAVISDLHFANDINSTPVQINTLDNFCEENKINEIDFLKIDTEGSELEVIKGAKNMLAKGNIKVIQLEFNEMNIISRVFLKDLFFLLKEYDFFRLDTSRLISLGKYSSIYEIFRFQNIVTIRKDLTKDLEI